MSFFKVTTFFLQYSSIYAGNAPTYDNIWKLCFVIIFEKYCLQGWIQITSIYKPLIIYQLPFLAGSTSTQKLNLFIKFI